MSPVAFALLFAAAGLALGYLWLRVTQIGDRVDYLEQALMDLQRARETGTRAMWLPSPALPVRAPTPRAAKKGRAR